MNQHNDGGPAFPVADFDPQTFSPKTVDELRRLLSGMSLRDYFAAKALNGVLQMVADGKHEPDITDLPIQQVDFIAKSAYELADAMLKARSA